MWEKIIVPLDGSNLAELAIPYAEALAGVFGSEVVLVCVCEPAESQYCHMHQLYIEKMAGQMKDRIKDYGIGVVAVSPVVLTGEPAGEIIDYAEKNNIGLIIMASHGRSGIMPWAMGSISNKVTHKTGTPVLLIRARVPYPEVDRRQILNKVLLPLDGSEAGEAAVPYIQELIARLESEVILFGVVPAGQHVRTVGGLDFVHYPEEHLELIKAEAKEYLERVYHRLSGGKGSVRIELKVGDVAHEIIKFAEETNAGFVAISAHGHSGIGKWVFGSIAHKILHASNTPVLLVKAPGAKV
ncbi:MAG: universal stress protein [Dehalococcoidia bacterium]|nr:universal stress protein [Dehalococcoidia bacterium]